MQLNARWESATVEPRMGSSIQVFFVSDSTGISAETMGNALLLQFPDLLFERRVIPFITGIDEAKQVVARLDAAADAGPAIAFSTAADDVVRQELLATRCAFIDFFEQNVGVLEELFNTPAMRGAARLHGIGDAKGYNARMAAVEYSIEHDDGASVRALDKADVILLAPSRCGKTPTTMYLALQHGVFVANYPLVPEDLEVLDLPRPVRALRERCFGITTTSERLAQVRNQRRPDSRYSSIDQCRWELKQAESMFRMHRIPTVDSAAKSVEEMSTLILQYLRRTPDGEDTA